MNSLMELLTNCCPHVDFETETKLLTDKHIDSMDLVEIIMRIQDQYNIKIDFSLITPDNFDSVESIHKMINELSNTGD